MEELLTDKLQAVASIEEIEDLMGDVEPFLSDDTAQRMWTAIDRMWKELDNS